MTRWETCVAPNAIQNLKRETAWPTTSKEKRIAIRNLQSPTTMTCINFTGNWILQTKGSIQSPATCASSVKGCSRVPPTSGCTWRAFTSAGSRSRATTADPPSRRSAAWSVTSTSLIWNWNRCNVIWYKRSYKTLSFYREIVQSNIGKDYL
jgi:hypothetical protein